MPRALGLAVLVASIGIFAGCNRVRNEAPAADAPADGERTGPPPPPVVPDDLPDSPAAAPAPAPDVKKSDARRPDAATPETLIVARWAVPAVKVNGAEDAWGATPEAVAVSDDGSRVLVKTAHTVDVWYRGQPAALRVQPRRLSRGFVSPDAARAYLVTDEPHQIETWDAASGRRLGTWAPPATAADPRPRFQAGGFDGTSHRLAVAVQGSDSGAIFAVDPDTGLGALATRLPQPHDASACRGVHPLPDGGYAVYYKAERNRARPSGVYTVSGTGAFRESPRIPADAGTFGPVDQHAVSADRRFVALIAGRKLQVWDLSAGTGLLSWAKEQYSPSGCQFTGDRVVLLAASHNERWYSDRNGKTVGVSGVPTLFQMFDVAMLKKVGEFSPTALGLPTKRFALSPNGRYVVVADNRTVAVLDADRAFGLTK